MSLTASQLRVILDEAALESGGKFTPFDPVFYANENAASVNAWLSAAGNAGKTLLDHFVEVGAVQGFRTSPEFNPQFYFQQWPDLQVAGLDGTELLAHYTIHGIAEGRAATEEMLAFDGERYLAENPDVAAYVNAHLDDFLGSASNGAAGHWVKFGALEGRAAYTLSGDPLVLFGLTEVPDSASITFAGGVLDLDTNQGATLLTKAATAADGSTTGGVLKLSGDTVVRIDLTNSGKQVTGIDLDGDGVIESNGIENNVAGSGILVAKNFTIVDAYARNPLNRLDDANNYLGNIFFDGTGFAGDGTKTNGNVFLGGLGNDTAFGGIGNDFMAGGGSPNFGQVGQNSSGDFLSGGRNSDFFYGELSALSPTDGENSHFDGGATADNTVATGFPTPGTINLAGGLGTQDNDVLLLEASDDEEQVFVDLGEGNFGGFVGTNDPTGQQPDFRMSDVESVNASGNLYGFLNTVDTVVGARSYDGYGDGFKAGTENYGRGSTAQLDVDGSQANNLIIGGFDNDQLRGNDGDDLIGGGDIQFLINNRNNPNILNATGGLNLTPNAVGVVFDGRDGILGGNGDDQIMFEADGGTINGDADTGKTSGAAGAKDDRPYAGPRFASQGDGLFLTNFSTGRLNGAVLADEATAQGAALAKMTTDSTVRIDLGTGNAFKGYGGAATGSQDTTNYATGVTRSTVATMESVNTTGLGAIDYKAAGSNTPDLKFNNQQNYFGLNANVDLRGTGADNALLANTGTDTVEGRGGDDVMSGGAGNDKLVVAFGDGVDWVARPVDANADNIWDVTGGLTVQGGLAWGQDFRAASAPTAGATTLVVDFGATVINGVDTFVGTFQVQIDGVAFGTDLDAGTLAKAKNTTELASIVNANYHAKDANVTVVATSATVIQVKVVDATPADATLPDVSDTPAEGFFVLGTAPGAGNTFSAGGSILGQSGSKIDDDRAIVKSYDQAQNGDRAINLGADQTKFQISQAAEMAASFSAGGSELVQGQAVRLYINEVREGDRVTVTINGTEYGYTVKAGQDSNGAADGLRDAINNFLDINSASGQVNAASDPGAFGDDAANPANRAGVLIQQTVVQNSLTFMNVSAAVTRPDGATPFGTVATHNQSNTDLQLLGFDGRNGGLTADDGTPVVLFQGRNGGTTTMSLLATAKDAGQTLTGINANYSTPGDVWVNGDDLLYGGKGNDKLIGGTGDDRFIMSAGTDTVFGDNEDGTGRFDLLADGTTKQIYQDVLQAEEGIFGTGTKFAVTLDAAVAGKGVLLALDDKGAVIATTNFSGIELVRALENNRASSLDLKAVSDATCVVIGNDSLPGEGLYVLLTRAPQTFTWIDANGNGILEAKEQSAITAVLGVENLTTGNAPDFVTLDQTQGSANNVLDLGAQQDNTVTLRESADTVTYNHQDINNDGKVNALDLASARPTMTVAVLGASSSKVGMTAGALGKTTSTDTLTNVEVVDLTNAATSDRFNDVLDLSGLAAGATVNYGVAEDVGKSVGGQNAPVATVAQGDANKLDSGGVALTGNALGTELLTITDVTGAAFPLTPVVVPAAVVQPSAAIITLEHVTGSASNDRVIVADKLEAVGTGDFAAAPGPRITVFDNNFALPAGVNPVPFNVADQGLYQWNLGAGPNDMVDYKQETGILVVSVDTTAGDNELIWVDVGTATPRVDSATGVERFFGGNNGNNNWIDLGGATVDTTIEFSKETTFVDPAGNDGTAGDQKTRTAVVSNSTDNTEYAKFVDRAGGTVTGPSFWTQVWGSAKAETVLLTDNETTLNNAFWLLGGKNKVDYSALTTTITAFIGQTQTGTPGLIQDVNVQTGVNFDFVRQLHAGDPATNNLTLVGSSVDDLLNVSTLQAVNTAIVADPGKPTTGQVDPLFNVVDLGAGVVTESLFGQYNPVAAPATVANRAFQTFVSDFENVTNAGSAFVVHLLGDSNINGLVGGTGDDLIYGARGTAPGNVALLVDQRGDQLTGGAGADVFLYKAEGESPGGAFNVDQTGFTSQIAADNSIDHIVDFVTGVDKLAFVIDDTYDAVKASGPVPFGALGGVLAPVVPMVAPVFGATTNINIPRSGGGTTPNDFDNYAIDGVAAGAITDLILRVKATSSNDVIDFSAGLDAAVPLNVVGPDVRVDLVYTAVSESPGGAGDEIIHFTTTEDKIDLSFLKLPRYESSKVSTGVDYDTDDDNIVDADPADTFGAVRALGPAAVTLGASIFIDGVVYKPVAVQESTDGNGDPSTVVFIDADGNGKWDGNADLQLTLVGVGGVNGPVSADFIFNQYGGGWGG